MVPEQIRRVVSCFLLRHSHQEVAVFHRESTMPTFPSHWAAISGSIEASETPLQTAWRELDEETNLIQNNAIELEQQGLFLDVPFHSSITGKSSTIRVYPFAFRMRDDNFDLQTRGTEHDNWKWIKMNEMETVHPTVPELARAFHHATCGKYLPIVSKEARQWASDKENGASVMALKALQLLKDAPGTVSAEQLRILRPSMVAITNALDALTDQTIDEVQSQLEKDAKLAHDFALAKISSLIRTGNVKTIATFSRSATLTNILQLLLQKHRDLRVLCSQSSPGDEGLLMAHDLSGSVCVDDMDLLQCIRDGTIDLILIGADCVTQQHVVNKIGTKKLVEVAKKSNVPVYCCTDRWKLWKDIFPPPLEDIFEMIPKELMTSITIPPDTKISC